MGSDGPTSVHEFEVKSIDGGRISLSTYRGKVLLVVNVASQCGFTPQYAGLESLYEKYRDQGLEVLGFPCNQFGSQEPEAEAGIKTFCETSFGVKFPLFAKIEVNGPGADPLYKFLTRERPGILGTSRIKWNFTKFLVDREGCPVKRFPPTTTPESIEPAVRRLLETPDI
jgi:glutathione peroxidase